MKAINYFLDGFGFENFADFKNSTIGFMMSEKVIAAGGAFASLTWLGEVVFNIFGINYAFFIAYVILIIFEWITGVSASLHRGEPHKSRKLGRMMLKLSAYSVPIYILNTFRMHSEIPPVFGFEINPFAWLFYLMLLVIIWQLFVSLLENLASLKVRYAAKLIVIINKKFYEQLGIDKEENNNL